MTATRNIQKEIENLRREIDSKLALLKNDYLAMDYWHRNNWCHGCVSILWLKGLPYMLASEPLSTDEDIKETKLAIAEADAGGPFVAQADMLAWLKSISEGKKVQSPKATIYTA